MARVHELSIAHSARSVTDLLAILADGKMAQLVKDVSYTWAAPITIPAGAVILNPSAVAMIYTGDMTAPPLTIEADVTCEDLYIQIPLPPVSLLDASDSIIVAPGFRGGRIRAECASVASSGGTLFYLHNSGLDLDTFETVDVARPYLIGVDPDISTAPTEGGFIRSIDIQGYRCGVNLSNTDGFRNLTARFRDKHPLSPGGPGDNGIIINHSTRFYFGHSDIADAGEHAIRLSGGQVDGATTMNGEFGTIIARRPGIGSDSGGCALKINAYDDLVDGIKVERLILEGGWTADPGDNRNLLRCCHAKNVHVTYAEAYPAAGATIACSHAVAVNDVDGLTIDHLRLHGGIGNVFNADEARDVSVESPRTAGPVKNVVIGRISGANTLATNSSFVNISMTGQDIGGLLFDNVSYRGTLSNAISYGGGTAVDTIEMYGRIEDGAVFNAIPDTDFWFCEVSNGPRKYRGRMARYHTTRGSMILNVPAAFDPADLGTNYAGLYLNASGLTAGTGLRGAALMFSRPGSSRRAAAIFPEQGGAAQEQDLCFYAGGTLGSADNLNQRLRVRYDGDVELYVGGRGMILKSPDGTRYKLTIANGGTVSVVPA